MWSREFIKIYAKDFLRKHYWKAFLVCIIVSMLGSGSSKFNLQKPNNYYQNQIVSEKSNKILLELNNPVLNFTIRKLGKPTTFYIAKKIIPIIILFFLILSITVGYTLEVGKVI